jgi:uncharacterized protein (DUF1697 family)
MTTHVALVRAVNVGGRKLGMADLRNVCAELGYADVQTYVQSGNVVFDAAGPAARIGKDLEGRIAADLGIEVAVLMRSPKDLARVIEGNPYLRRGEEPSSLHVTFLAEPAKRDAQSRLEAPGAGADELVVAGRHVYVFCPNGYGRTKLNNTFIERRLGVAATTRNWRTVTTLLELATR